MRREAAVNDTAVSGTGDLEASTCLELVSDEKPLSVNLDFLKEV